MSVGPSPEPERVLDVGEFGLIERLRAIVGVSSAVTGIGDDAAVIDLGAPELLLATVDMQVQDVHFRLEDSEPREIGRRAVAVNISDIAAMGGVPKHVLASIALPPATSVAWVENVYAGMSEEARRWEADIVGGNVTRIDGTVSLDIVLLGSVPPDEAVLRSGGHAGDVLAVTGPLGGAAAARLGREAGLDLPALVGSDWVQRAATVHPRVREGRALAAHHLAHAMLDLSDGLAGDLVHLCRASGTGAEIDARRLPIEPEVHAIAEALGLDAVTLALSGGEDYELLVALDGTHVIRAGKLGIPLSPIGRLLSAEAGIALIDANGQGEPLEESAWRHF